MKAITFTDIRDKETSRRNKLGQELAELKARAKKDKVLPPRLEARKNEIEKLVSNPVVDGVYVKLQDLLATMVGGQQVGAHKDGKPPSSVASPVQKLTPDEIRLIAVYGLLHLDGDRRPEDTRFGAAVTKTLGEYVSNQALYDRVLALLIDDGDISRQTNTGGTTELYLNAQQWVAVARALGNEGVGEDDSLLPLKVRVALAKLAGGDGDKASSVVEIDLPDLEAAAADGEILADNLVAMQALYYASVLEEMKLFYARDMALEQWQLGMIVTGRGRAGDLFYKMWRKTPDRFSEVERLSLYARCFGTPGGDALHGQPNREFKTLWVRFLSAVSALIRQYNVDNLIKASIPAAIHQEQVRQSGRDLAANLSLHGFGIAYFAAAELQHEVADIIELFSEGEVKAAYASRDMYQVIEQIVLYSGGQIESSVQKRVTANAGAVIIRWLAKNAARLAGNSLGSVLDIGTILNPLPSPPGQKATLDPSDLDLVNAVEQWLAVNGVQDEFIEQNAQPMVPPRLPSRPIQMPSVARDILDSVGVATEHGAGLRRGSSPFVRT